MTESVMRDGGSKRRRASWLGTLARVFNTNKTSWIGLGIMVLIVILAALTPFVAPYDPYEQHLADRLIPPSHTYWFGTDNFGRDVLSRVLWGGQISLSIGILSTLFGMVIGALIGIIAGYKGGYVDHLSMRLMDIFLSFPGLILCLLIIAMLGPSVANLIFAIGIAVMPKFARVARGPTIAVKEKDFIEACRCLGYSDVRIIGGHILPNIAGEILVMVALWTAHAILIEASLSFLGLGLKPPIASWGGMMREGLERMSDAPWLTICPGLAILVTVFGLNLLGDGLRDAVDPKLRDD